MKKTTLTAKNYAQIERIIRIHVSKGDLTNAVESAKIIGRKLNAKELDKIISVCLKDKKNDKEPLYYYFEIFKEATQLGASHQVIEKLIVRYIATGSKNHVIALAKLISRSLSQKEIDKLYEMQLDEKVYKASERIYELLTYDVHESSGTQRGRRKMYPSLSVAEKCVDFLLTQPYCEALKWFGWQVNLPQRSSDKIARVLLEKFDYGDSPIEETIGKASDELIREFVVKFADSGKVDKLERLVKLRPTAEFVSILIPFYEQEMNKLKDDFIKRHKYVEHITRTVCSYFQRSMTEEALRKIIKLNKEHTPYLNEDLVANVEAPDYIRDEVIVDFLKEGMTWHALGVFQKCGASYELKIKLAKELVLGLSSGKLRTDATSEKWSYLQNFQLKQEDADTLIDFLSPSTGCDLLLILGASKNKSEELLKIAIEKHNRKDAENAARAAGRKLTQGEIDALCLEYIKKYIEEDGREWEQNHVLQTAKELKPSIQVLEKFVLACIEKGLLSCAQKAALLAKRQLTAGELKRIVRKVQKV